MTGGSTDLALQLQGRGKSLPALLGSLNGEVQVKIGSHRVNNFAVDLGGGVLRLFSLANPFRKTDPDIDAKCLAALVVTPIVTDGAGSGDVRTIVLLSGPLAAPTLRVDPITIVKSAASVGAAVALPGVGWIAESLLRKAAVDPTPCATALARVP